MKRRYALAAAVALVSVPLASPRAPLRVPQVWTTTGPLGGRVRDFESDSGGVVCVAGEVMTPHFGVASCWDPFTEATGLPPNTRDFGRPDTSNTFVLAGNGENGGLTGGVFSTQNFYQPVGSPGAWAEFTAGLPVKDKSYFAAAVDLTSTQLLYVGYSGAVVANRGVWATRDGGAPWNHTLSGVVVNALAVGPSGLLNYVFAATPSGIYRGPNDGGAAMTLVENTPAVDIVVHPNGSAVYAVIPRMPGAATPSTRVISSTSGGSGTWTVFFDPGGPGDQGEDLRAITRPHALAPNLFFVGGAATTAGPAGSEEGEGLLYQRDPATLTWGPNLITFPCPCPTAGCMPPVPPGSVAFPRGNPIEAVFIDRASPALFYIGFDTAGVYWTNNSNSVPPCPFQDGNMRNPLCMTPGPGTLIGTHVRELAAQPRVPPGGGAGSVFASGDSRTVWWRDPTSGNWTARHVPPLAPGLNGWGWHAITSIGFDIQNNRLYVGDGSRLQYSDNNGLLWNLIGTTFAGEVTEIGVAPEVANPTSGFATLLVGTTAGGYRSANGGATFGALTPPANVENFTFHRGYTSTSNHTVFAAVPGPSGGFYSAVGSDGTSWIQSNTGLPADPGLTIVGHAGGNVLYVGSGNGNLLGVFVSTDLGQNWFLPSGLTGLQALVFGLAVETVGGADVVYAATRGGVLRSSNQGASWTGYSGGLENTRCGPLRLSATPGAPTPLGLFVGTEGRGVSVSITS